MNDIVMESAAYVRKTLKATKRPGITDLLQHMDDIGFFTAPASGGNHLCCEGGLVVHTANVMKLAEKMGKVLLAPEEFKEQRNSIRIVSGLHDLGKCGAWNKVYYAELQSTRPRGAGQVQRLKIIPASVISIHPAPRGGTLASCSSTMFLFYFNPPAPEGRDRTAPRHRFCG